MDCENKAELNPYSYYVSLKMGITLLKFVSVKSRIMDLIQSVFSFDFKLTQPELLIGVISKHQENTK